METVTVTLGGETHAIRQLPYREAKAWRERAGEPLGELAQVLLIDLEQAAGDLSGIAGLVQVGRRVIVGAPDVLVDLFFAYAVDLQPQREAIEARTTDGELMAAFLEVLKLAYPFGGLLGLLGLGGRQDRSTSKSSPLPSGASRRKT